MADTSTKNPIRIAANAVKGAADKTRAVFSRNKGANAANATAETSSETSRSRISFGTPSITGALGTTNQAIGRAAGLASSGALYGGWILGAAAMFSKVPFLGKALQNVGEKVQQPDKLLNEKTVADISRVGSGVLGKAAEYANGIKGGEKLGEKLQGAAGAVSKHESALRSTVHTLSHRVTDPFARVVSTHAGGALSKASGLFRGPAGKKHSRALALLDEAIAKGGDAKGVSESLQAARSALGGTAGDLDDDAFQGALKTATQGLAGLSEGALDQSVIKSLQKSLGKVKDSANAASKHQHTANKISSVPDAIQNAPESIAKSNLKTAMNNTVAVSVTALQTIGTMKGIKGELMALKSMYMDLTGESKISTRKALFGKDVPDIIKEARGQIVKHYGPQALLNIAAAASNYAFRKDNSLKGKMGGFGINFLTEMHGKITEDMNLLQLYGGLSQGGMDMQPEHYAMLLSSASKHARQAGGIASPDVQALAMNYASEGADAVKVLQEVETGEIHNRAKAVFAARDAKSANAPEREVIGEHTQRMHDKDMGRGPNQVPSSAI